MFFSWGVRPAAPTGDNAYIHAYICVEGRVSRIATHRLELPEARE